MSKTRKDAQGGLDAQVQAICEKIVSSDLFINKLVETMSLHLLAIIENKLKEYEVKVKSLEDRIDQLEQQSRDKNLRIFGLPEADDETTKSNDDVTKLTDVINNKLKLPLKAEDFEYCYRLRKGIKNGPRPLMVKLHSKEVRNLIFRNKSKLKGTKVVIKEDLTFTCYKIQLEAGEFLGKTNVWSDEGQIKIKHHGKICKLKTLHDLDMLKSPSIEAM